MHYYGKSITEQLEKLFKKWIENQNEEVNNKNENYEGNNYLERYKGGNLRNLDLRNSFTRDGIVNEEAWIKGEKILFILKEANISEQLKDASEGNVIADNGKFWFRETIKSNNYNWKRRFSEDCVRLVNLGPAIKILV